VAVGIDESGEQALSLEVGASGGGQSFRDFGETANGEDLVTADGDGFGIGMLGIGGEDLCVEQNLILGVE